MRESPVQREVVVPGDMRVGRQSARAASQRTARRVGGRISTGECVAALRACGAWIADRCLTRPGETAGVAVALGAAIYISVNALGFQEGRHPAPILPQPKAQFAEAEAAKESAKPPPRAIPLPAREDTQASGPRDPIGETIRTAAETTASVSPKPEKDVARAQRALTKLGFGPLKDDGKMGPGTKAAIEKFERDRKLPVTGAPTGKTLRALIARAGLPPG